MPSGKKPSARTNVKLQDLLHAASEPHALATGYLIDAFGGDPEAAAAAYDAMSPNEQRETLVSLLVENIDRLADECQQRIGQSSSTFRALRELRSDAIALKALALHYSDAAAHHALAHARMERANHLRSIGGIGGDRIRDRSDERRSFIRSVANRILASRPALSLNDLARAVSRELDLNELSKSHPDLEFRRVPAERTIRDMLVGIRGKASK